MQTGSESNAVGHDSRYGRSSIYVIGRRKNAANASLALCCRSVSSRPVQRRRCIQSACISDYNSANSVDCTSSRRPEHRASHRLLYNQLPRQATGPIMDCALSPVDRDPRHRRCGGTVGAVRCIAQGLPPVSWAGKGAGPVGGNLPLVS